MANTDWDSAFQKTEADTKPSTDIVLHERKTG